MIIDRKLYTLLSRVIVKSVDNVNFVMVFAISENFVSAGINDSKMKWKYLKIFYATNLCIVRMENIWVKMQFSVRRN